jgi:lysophospholipase L1-like esterase
VAPDAAILLTTNTDSFMKRKYPNRNAGSVRDVMFRLSASENVAVWDTYGVMGGEGSIKLWERSGLAQADRVHFKREGYALLGDLLFTALTEAYGTYLRTSER